MLRNLLPVLIKYGSTFLFVLLELICIYLIVQNNKTQRSIWLNSSNIFSGQLYERVNLAKNFVNLREENNALAIENAALRAQLLEQQFKANSQDSIIAANFDFIPALVINNSTNKLNNKITLNVGSKAGVKKGMGVVDRNGIVGIVAYVNSNYCMVVSVLNISTNISAMIAKTKTLGSLQWKGKRLDRMELMSIPQYIEAEVGDSIVTSGYSTVFPKGHMVGTIKTLKQNVNTGYSEIEVELNNNILELEHVYIVKNIIYEDLEKFQARHE